MTGWRPSDECLREFAAALILYGILFIVVENINYGSVRRLSGLAILLIKRL